MSIEVAKTAGFCFGVNRAVQMVYDLIEAGESICTLGPIIHNPQLVEELAEKEIDGLIIEPSKSQIFCRHTDRIKPLDPLKDGFNFVDVNLFIAHTFENIFQRDSQITGVINGIDDRGSNRAVSVGKWCQLDLPHQVIL